MGWYALFLQTAVAVALILWRLILILSNISCNMKSHKKRTIELLFKVWHNITLDAALRKQLSRQTTRKIVGSNNRFRARQNCVIGSSPNHIMASISLVNL